MSQLTPWEFRRVRTELYGQTQAQFAKEIGLEGAWAARTVRAYEGGTQKIIGPVARCVELLRERKEGKRKP